MKVDEKPSESTRDKSQFCTQITSPVVATFKLNNVSFSINGKGETNLKGLEVSKSHERKTAKPLLKRFVGLRILRKI